MKKVLSFVLVFATLIGIFSCSKKEVAEEVGTEGSVLRIAMVTDSGDITDQSFNQTSY